MPWTFCSDAGAVVAHIAIDVSSHLADDPFLNTTKPKGLRRRCSSIKAANQRTSTSIVRTGRDLYPQTLNKPEPPMPYATYNLVHHYRLYRRRHRQHDHAHSPGIHYDDIARNSRVDHWRINRPNIFETRRRFHVSSGRPDLIDHWGDYRAVHSRQIVDAGVRGLLCVCPNSVSPTRKPPFFTSIGGRVCDAPGQHLICRTAEFRSRRALSHFFQNLK